MSWLYSIVFAGILFSSGSDTISVETTSIPTETVIQERVQGETERFEQTYPINANGRVSVSNINGSITVTAWDRKEVKVVAVKTAETRERLADFQIRVDARPEFVQVETDYGDWKWKDKSSGEKWKDSSRLVVDYELSVPRTAMLNEIETVNGTVTVADFVNFTKISVVNGAVKATNLRGTASLSTVNGEVAADFEQLDSTSKISLETVNGKVNLVIPSDANATVKADSLNGTITNDFGLPVRKGRYIGRDLYGRLGSGDVSIKLGSVNGGLSVKRRSDGRSLSPATNLLPQKGTDDEEWDDPDKDVDIDNDKDAKISIDTGKINREVTRAVREAHKEMVKLKPEIEKATKEGVKAAADAIKLEQKEIQSQIKASMDQQKAVMAAMREASFVFGVPRIETKSDSIPVKGVPKVTIDAKGCSVRVRGWDKQEVQYSVIQFANNGVSAPINLTEDHTDSVVNLRITNNKAADQNSFYIPDSRRMRIEIFVPKRSNLKIISDGEIRLEGVSGDLDVTGADESVNIRDSQGKLTLSNTDGRVRVIGFDGEVAAQTVDGDVYLEGSFSKLSGKAADGTMTLILTDGTAAEFVTNSEVISDGFELQRSGANTWRLGSGGPRYKFDFAGGNLVVRNSSLLSAN